MAQSENTAFDYRRRMCRAMNFINENLTRDVSLDEIARAACFSKYHFHRVFKTVVGETVSGFTRRLRLEWAANLLLADSRRSVTEIALECMFSSSQNFAKAFHQHFGATPSAYRKSNHGNKLRNPGNAKALRLRYDADTMFTGPQTREVRVDMNPEVKEMPEYHVAFVRKVGPYGKVTCGEAFGELVRWAGPRGYLKTGAVFGIYWDNPEVTPPGKCRLDACISVPKGTEAEAPLGFQTIAGGLYGVCHFEIGIDEFQQAWDDAFEWLVGSGHQCDDTPCYELYHNSAEDHPEGKWVVDICIPLRRRG